MNGAQYQFISLPKYAIEVLLHSRSTSHYGANHPVWPNHYDRVPGSDWRVRRARMIVAVDDDRVRNGQDSEHAAVRTVENKMDDEGLGQRAVSCARLVDDDTSVPYPISFRAGTFCAIYTRILAV